MRHVKTLGLAWVSLGLAVLLTGCLGGSDRPQRRPGSAIWLGSPAATDGEGPGAGLTPEVLGRLGDLGVGDFFLPFGRLRWAEEAPRVSFPGAVKLPRRTAVTLVIEGVWEDPSESPKRAGAALATEIQRAELEARSRGLLPGGIHLELRGARRPPDLSLLGEALAHCRRKMSPELLLSVGLRGSWLSKEGAGEVAAAADFLVAWLYGQRPRDLRRSGILDDRWNLSRIDQVLDELEALKTPYLVGVVTLGSALHRDRGGEVQAITHTGDLESLVLSRAFKLSGGFVLSAADCRRYDFEVLRAGRFGGWSLDTGETVTVVGLTPSLLEKYLRQREALELRYWLGELFFRMPSPEDAFSLGPEGLAAAFGRLPVEQALVGRVEEWRTRGRSYVLRVSVENRLPEATEISTLDSNFLEVTVPGGWFGSVAPGDFHRYQLLRRSADGTLTPTLRRPDVLRLYRPILGAGRKVESGSVAVYLGGGPAEPSLGGRFLLASGSFLEVSQALPEAGEAPEADGAPEGASEPGGVTAGQRSP